MKALTLIQPWASLVAIGAKRIETRSWSTDYRGPIAIHAGKTFPDNCQSVCLTEPFRSILKQQTHYRVIWNRATKQSDFPLGCVIAICELVGVRRMRFGPEKIIGFECGPQDGTEYKFELTEQEKAFGFYKPGRFAWLLHNVRPIIPAIPAKGSLGLWNFNDIDLGPVPGEQARATEKAGSIVETQLKAG